MHISLFITMAHKQSNDFIDNFSFCKKKTTTSTHESCLVIDSRKSMIYHGFIGKVHKVRATNFIRTFLLVVI